jgi:polyferredoxin
LFVERPWCKYACPYGAVLGITNLFRIFKIQRQPSTCINCGLCTKQCPMNIDVANKTIIKDHQCISCLECTSEAVCPVPETVTLKAGR